VTKKKVTNNQMASPPPFNASLNASVSPKKIGLFFGAGAEMAYGLPSGGKFAIEIFRRSPDQQKQRFKELLTNLQRRTNYAVDYLPPEFPKKRLNVFGKPDFTSLLQSSIEYRRAQVLEFLNSFDVHATSVVQKSGLTQAAFETAYQKEIGQPFGKSNYQSAIRLNDKLGDENKLFGSHYFSACLDVLNKRKDARLLRRCLTAFLQLLVGCCGQKLASDLNEQIFSDAPEDIPIFDDVGGIFQIEFSQAGLSALEIILEEKPQKLTENSTLIEMAGEFCRGTLERLFEGCLDYQSLLDSHFRYVYDPKASWAKFTKICIFLNVVRDYIIEGLPDDERVRNDFNGYYHDLVALKDYGLIANGVGTTNYNRLIDTVCGTDAPSVYHLNGSVSDFYDPYLNQIVTLSNPDAEYTKQEHVLVPMLFTQSGIKPLTSIEMSRRYVELFDHFKACYAIVVIGFGFNGDDGHINGLFRELIQTEQKHVYVCAYSPNGFNESAFRGDYRKKLRLEHDPTNLHLIPVNRERQTSEGLM
jgi:hypothetical protein